MEKEDIRWWENGENWGTENSLESRRSWMIEARAVYGWRGCLRIGGEYLGLGVFVLGVPKLGDVGFLVALGCVHRVVQPFV